MTLYDFLLQKLNTDFIRNVTVLASGNGVSQGIAVLALPILTRLYLPEAFGGYALYVSIVSVISSLITLQYEQALVLPNKQKEAVCLLMFCLGIVGATSSLAFGIILILARSSIISLFFIDVNLNTFVWLISPSLFLTGLHQVLYFWFIRKKQFKQLAYIRLIQIITTITIQLIIGFWFDISSLGLIAGVIIGQIIAVILQSAVVWRDDATTIYQYFDIQTAKKQAITYKKFFLFSSWMSVVDRLQSSMAEIFLSLFFGVAVTGHYFMAKRLLHIPSALIGEAVSRVLLQKVAEVKTTTGNVAPLVERAFRWLCGIAFIYFIVVLFTSPIFEVILGSDWTEVGQYIRILALPVSIMLVSSPLSLVIAALDKHELGAVWQITSVISTALFLALSIPFDQIYTTLWLLACNNVLLYIFYAYLILRSAETGFFQSLTFHNYEQNQS